MESSELIKWVSQNVSMYVSSVCMSVAKKSKLDQIRPKYDMHFEPVYKHVTDFKSLGNNSPLTTHIHKPNHETTVLFLKRIDLLR